MSVAHPTTGTAEAAGNTARSADPRNSTGSSRGASPSVFDVIRDEVQLFRTPDSRPFAVVEVGGRKISLPILESHFADYVRYRHLKIVGKPPVPTEVSRTRDALAALARMEGPVHDVHVRIAHGKDGCVYVDRGPEADTYVRIAPDGWDLVESVPVRFWRPRGMRTLPEPRPGSIDALRPYLNVRSEDDARLILAWLVAAYRQEPPHWILILQGPQGSGKSTVSRVLMRIVHPCDVDTRQPPRSCDDLLIAALHAPVLVYDNLSRIPRDQSDELCRLATGGGLGKRQLYKDAQEFLARAACRTILTAIGDLAEHDDLRERSIILDLPKLERTEVLDEDEEFWPAFDAALPEILGGVYDAVSCALRRTDVRPRELHRMSGPALWAHRAEEAFGWPDGSFLEAYWRNQEESIATVIEYDPVAPYLRRLAAVHGTWVGTATDLLRALRKLRQDECDRDPAFPQSAAALSQQIARIAPALREVGVEIKRWREPGGSRTRLIAVSSDGFRSLEQAQRWCEPIQQRDRTHGESRAVASGGGNDQQGVPANALSRTIRAAAAKLFRRSEAA